MRPHEQSSGLRNVRFAYRAPDVGSVALVCVAGDWLPQVLPMTRRADGEWVVDVELPAGRYRYGYVVDERWCSGAVCDGTIELAYTTQVGSHTVA
ncbi:MAG: hypothetical protein ACE5F9_06465 [Phycisphaerae bacterium]